ncbi:30S ribosomal protein S4 [Candidatus Peregrinibacteria bacterium]|nr:30S ribosomal protein S4 [Candidatus Peregrinibacteria bacterium]
MAAAVPRAAAASDMRYTGPKARRCRREGINLYGAAKYEKILQHKPYPPGKTPKSRLGRQSEYARQLRMKQRLRDVYGISEAQCRRLYLEASAMKGQTGVTMLQFLERRMDNVLYRAGFARTRMQARQMASHGLFTVNGRRVTLPSLRVAAGETIAIRTRSKGSPLFVDVPAAQQKFAVPTWLKSDPALGNVEITGIPLATDAEQAVDIRQVVEFYSRS